MPRFAFQYQDKAYYSAIAADGSFTLEVIDNSSGTPAPGTGIQLDIGRDNRPQVVYMHNGNLIHNAKYFGTVWGPSVVETVNTGGYYDFGFAVDRHSQPRVSYFDSIDQTLLYAYRLRFTRLGVPNRWRIESPEASSPAGSYSDLLVDEYNRTHIAYYKNIQNTVDYYVEPHFLDYTSVDTTDIEDISNTLTITPAIQAPTNVNAIPSGYFGAALSWDSVAGATSYNIYWNHSGTVTYGDTVIAEVTDASYLHQGLEDHTGYHYVVTANTSLGESLLSTEVTTTTFIQEWTIKNPPTVTIEGAYHLGEVVNGKFYLFGGKARSATLPFYTQCHEYDYVTDTWTTKSSIPSGHNFTGASSIVVNDKFYVVGVNLDIYDPATDTWTTMSSPPRSSDRAFLTFINGKIYAAYDYANVFSIYDIATDTWTETSPAPRYSVSCLFAQVNNKIYRIGGDGSSTEEYDPATDTWTTKSPASSPGYPILITYPIVINNRIFALSSTLLELPLQEYDPFTDTWFLRGAHLLQDEFLPRDSVFKINDEIFMINVTIDESWTEIGATVEAFTPSN